MASQGPDQTVGKAMALRDWFRRIQTGSVPVSQLLGTLLSTALRRLTLACGNTIMS